MFAAGLAALTLALAGCGVSVHRGGEDAATNPASGIWVSPTDGADNTSGHVAPPTPVPTLPATPPPARPPAQVAIVTKIQAAVTGGCWQNAALGNVYGAYDQHFWWMGECGDTAAQVAIELYPTSTAASASAHHPSPTSLLARFLAGNVLVSVYSNAPQTVLEQLSSVPGLTPVPGYGG
jgi:hypothetical protein